MYNKLGSVIAVDLEEDNFNFDVIAFYNADDIKAYTTTLYLKNKGVDDLFLMEDFENVYIGQRKHINNAIEDYVKQAYVSGSFDKYVDRYNEYIEMSKLGYDVVQG